MRDLAPQESTPKRAGLEQALHSGPSTPDEPLRAGLEEGGFRHGVLRRQDRGEIGSFLLRLLERGEDSRPLLIEWFRQEEEWNRLLPGQQKEILRFLGSYRTPAPAGMKLFDFFEEVTRRRFKWPSLLAQGTWGMEETAETEEERSRTLRAVQRLWKESYRGGGLREFRENLLWTAKRLGTAEATQWVQEELKEQLQRQATPSGEVQFGLPFDVNPILIVGSSPVEIDASLRGVRFPERTLPGPILYVNNPDRRIVIVKGKTLIRKGRGLDPDSALREYLRDRVLKLSSGDSVQSRQGSLPISLAETEQWHVYLLSRDETLDLLSEGNLSLTADAIRQRAVVMRVLGVFDHLVLFTLSPGAALSVGQTAVLSINGQEASPHEPHLLWKGDEIELKNVDPSKGPAPRRLKELGTGLEEEPLMTLWTGEVSGRDEVTVLGFSPEGERLAAGDGLGNIRLWNIQFQLSNPSKRRKAERNFVHPGLKSLVVLPGGERLVSASDKGTIRTWRIADSTIITLPLDSLDLKERQTSGRGKLRLSPDGRIFALIDGKTPSIQIFDRSTGRLSQRLSIGEGGGITDVAFGLRGNRLVSISQDGTLQLWDLEAGTVRRVGLSPIPGVKVTALGLSPDGKTIAFGSVDGDLRLVEAVSGQTLNWAPRYRNESVGSIAFHPNGRVVASGHSDGAVKLWETPTSGLEETEVRLLARAKARRNFALPAQGSSLAVGGVLVHKTNDSWSLIEAVNPGARSIEVTTLKGGQRQWRTLPSVSLQNYLYLPPVILQKGREVSFTGAVKIVKERKGEYRNITSVQFAPPVDKRVPAVRLSQRNAWHRWLKQLAGSSNQVALSIFRSQVTSELILFVEPGQAGTHSSQATRQSGLEEVKGERIAEDTLLREGDRLVDAGRSVRYWVESESSSGPVQLVPLWDKWDGKDQVEVVDRPFLKKRGFRRTPPKPIELIGPKMGTTSVQETIDLIKSRRWESFVYFAVPGLSPDQKRVSREDSERIHELLRSLLPPDNFNGRVILFASGPLIVVRPASGPSISSGESLRTGLEEGLRGILILGQGGTGPGPESLREIAQGWRKSLHVSLFDTASAARMGFASMPYYSSVEGEDPQFPVSMDAVIVNGNWEQGKASINYIGNLGEGKKVPVVVFAPWVNEKEAELQRLQDAGTLAFFTPVPSDPQEEKEAFKTVLNRLDAIVRSRAAGLEEARVQDRPAFQEGVVSYVDGADQDPYSPLMGRPDTCRVIGEFLTATWSYPFQVSPEQVIVTPGGPGTVELMVRMVADLRGAMRKPESERQRIYVSESLMDRYERAAQKYLQVVPLTSEGNSLPQMLKGLRSIKESRPQELPKLMLLDRAEMNRLLEEGSRDEEITALWTELLNFTSQNDIVVLFEESRHPEGVDRLFVGLSRSDPVWKRTCFFLFDLERQFGLEGYPLGALVSFNEGIQKPWMVVAGGSIAGPSQAVQAGYRSLLRDRTGKVAAALPESIPSLPADRPENAAFVSPTIRTREPDPTLSLSPFVFLYKEGIPKLFLQEGSDYRRDLQGIFGQEIPVDQIESVMEAARMDRTFEQVYGKAEQAGILKLAKQIQWNGGDGGVVIQRLQHAFQEGKLTQEEIIQLEVLLHVVSLHVGAPWWPREPWLKEAVKEGLWAGSRWRIAEDLLQAEADYLHRTYGLKYGFGEISSGFYGSKTALQEFLLALEAVKKKPVSVFIPEPFYVGYLSSLLSIGIPWEQICPFSTQQENRFLPTPEEVEQAFQAFQETEPGIKVLLLTSPGNPTSAVISQEQLAALVELLSRRNELSIILDLAYGQLIFDGRPFDLSLLPEGVRNRIALLRTQSKEEFHPGGRLGSVAIKDPEIIVRMKRQRVLQADRLAMVAQGMGYSDQDRGFFDRVMEGHNHHLEGNAKILTDLFDRYGIRYSKPEGGFYLWFQKIPSLTPWDLGLTHVEGSAFFADPNRGKDNWRFSFAGPRSDIKVAAQRLDQALQSTGLEELPTQQERLELARAKILELLERPKELRGVEFPLRPNDLYRRWLQERFKDFIPTTTQIQEDWAELKRQALAEAKATLAAVTFAPTKESPVPIFRELLRGEALELAPIWQKWAERTGDRTFRALVRTDHPEEVAMAHAFIDHFGILPGRFIGVSSGDKRQAQQVGNLLQIRMYPTDTQAEKAAREVLEKTPPKTIRIAREVDRVFPPRLEELIKAINSYLTDENWESPNAAEAVQALRLYLAIADVSPPGTIPLASTSTGLEEAVVQEATGYVVVGPVALMVPRGTEYVYAVTVGVPQTQVVIASERIPPDRIVAVANPNSAGPSTPSDERLRAGLEERPGWERSGVTVLSFNLAVSVALSGLEEIHRVAVAETPTDFAHLKGAGIPPSKALGLLWGGLEEADYLRVDPRIGGLLGVDPTMAGWQGELIRLMANQAGASRVIPVFDAETLAAGLEDLGMPGARILSVLNRYAEAEAALSPGT